MPISNCQNGQICYNVLQESVLTSTKGNIMAVNYNPLWHLLIEKGMKKKDLRELTGISTNTLAKLGKNQDVSTSIIAKICTALDCKVEDVMEFVPENK